MRIYGIPLSCSFIFRHFYPSILADFFLSAQKRPLFIKASRRTPFWFSAAWISLRAFTLILLHFSMHLTAALNCSRNSGKVARGERVGSLSLYWVTVTPAPSGAVCYAIDCWSLVVRPYRTFFVAVPGCSSRAWFCCCKIAVDHHDGYSSVVDIDNLWKYLGLAIR